MLIEVGWKKASRLVSSSRGVREGTAVADESSVRSQSDEPMHQGDKVHRTVTSRVVASLRKERQEQLGLSSSGSTRPSTRLRDGDIREQRPDATLDVLSAARTSTGNNKNRLHQTC